MKKVCWWNDPLLPPIKSRKDTALETANTAANQLESTMTGMQLQSDGSSTAVDPTKWMFSAANRESSKNEFLFDSGAATSRCQQCFSDSLGGKPSGAGVDLRSATRPRDTIHHDGQHTDLHAHTSGDMQIAPKTTGLQRSIIGKIIVFHRSSQCSTK